MPVCVCVCARARCGHNAHTILRDSSLSWESTCHLFVNLDFMCMFSQLYYTCLYYCVCGNAIHSLSSHVWHRAPKWGPITWLKCKLYACVSQHSLHMWHSLSLPWERLCMLMKTYMHVWRGLFMRMTACLTLILSDCLSVCRPQKKKKWTRNCKSSLCPCCEAQVTTSMSDEWPEGFRIGIHPPDPHRTCDPHIVICAWRLAFALVWPYIFCLLHECPTCGLAASLPYMHRYPSIGVMCAP